MAEGQQHKVIETTSDDWEEGETLPDEELEELGLERGIHHIRIEFDNEKTVSYTLCQWFIIFALNIIGIPLFFVLYPCSKYGISPWAPPRKVQPPPPPPPLSSFFSETLTPNNAWAQLPHIHNPPSPL